MRVRLKRFLVVVIVLAASHSAAALAQDVIDLPDDGGSVCELYIELCGQLGDGSDVPNLGDWPLGNDGDPASPYYYDYWYPEWVFLPTIFCGPDETYAYLHLVDAVTGERTYIREVCVADSAPISSAPTTPTDDEVWGSTPLPALALGISPSYDGITGMDIWLWYPGVTEVDPPLTVVQGGRTLTVTARATEYCWVMEDTRGALPELAPAAEFCATRGNNSTHWSNRPGDESADGAAATHLYNSRGDYTVTVETLWEGEYTYLGTTYSLGSVTRRTQFPYHVIEVRSVLVPE